MTLRSALEIVSIEDVERERADLAERSFSPEEYAGIAARRTQTTAGFLAAKRALVRLFSEWDGTRTFRECDFVLTHHAGGAPRVSSCPELPEPGGTLRVSISHTREFAYGLAVAEEGAHG